MNSLTKVLVGGILEAEKKKTTAIYGGGFKPPTKGHYNVVEKAAEQNPEIDDIIIYVGGGERDGITQAESIQVWELYKKYLPLKTTVEPVKAPIGDILRYAKEHPDEEVLWIIGARENNPEDFADIASRTRTIDKYPNLELRVIQTAGGVSGTAARKAIKDNNKEQFFHLIPDIEEKEQVWDIVSPVIKEVEEGTCGYNTDVKTGKKLDTPGGLEEGRPKKKDPKKGTGKKPEGSGRRLYTDEDPKDTVRIKFKTKEDIVDTLNKKSFKAKSHARQSQIINLIHQRVRAAYGKAKDPEVKARLKRALDYIEARKEASKEKTQRLNKMKEASDPQAGTALPYGSGFAPIKESYQFKVSDKNYDEEDNSLISVDYEFSTPDNDYRVEFNSGEYSPESKTFDVSFGLDRYGSKIDTFQMTGEGNALSILKTIIDIIKDFTNRFEVNKLVINPTSEKRGKIYSMVLKALPQDILNKVELVKETKSDPFGINAYARELVKETFDKSWNPKESFVSLSKFMIDNGMNIQPLPKIKVIKDDEENASDLLGKTAYYNPNDKSITLYTMDRHPKDILRSFSHEMVHHEQNLENRLNNINTTNTNEDGDLPEIESEAYEKGNMMLRNWEDSIKNV